MPSLSLTVNTRYSLFCFKVFIIKNISLHFFFSFPLSLFLLFCVAALMCAVVFGHLFWCLESSTRAKQTNIHMKLVTSNPRRTTAVSLCARVSTTKNSVCRGYNLHLTHTLQTWESFVQQLMVVIEPPKWVLKNSCMVAAAAALYNRLYPLYFYCCPMCENDSSFTFQTYFCSR